MKKLYFLSVLLFIAASLITCNKRYIVTESDPVLSSSGAIPIINLGNSSCEDVNFEGIGLNFTFGTGKADYVEGNFVFEDPEKTWSDFGVTVTVSVDGKYIEFTSTENCVGAVIVKGGTGSNTYTYSPGVLHDGGLSAPLNPNGDPAAISNLTFCFVECPPSPEPLYIAVKSWFWNSYDFTTKVGTGYDYTISTALNTGSYPININAWCDEMGVNPLEASSFPLVGGVGTVTIEEGTSAWTIIVDLNEGMALDHTFLYIGSLSGLSADPMDTYGCPLYSSWINQNNSDENTHTFVIPY